MNIAQLRRKKVINVVDGEVIGFVDDLVLSDDLKKVEEIVIKRDKNRVEMVIPVQAIVTLGVEVIIVKVG